MQGTQHWEVNPKKLFSFTIKCLCMTLTEVTLSLHEEPLGLTHTAWAQALLPAAPAAAVTSHTCKAQPEVTNRSCCLAWQRAPSHVPLSHVHQLFLAITQHNSASRNKGSNSWEVSPSAQRSLCISKLHQLRYSVVYFKLCGSQVKSSFT